MDVFRSVRVESGPSGWGTELRLTPTMQRSVVLSLTAGGVSPVAQKIAELSGAEAVDGFTHHIPDARVVCAVIDCGGTARVGVYPRKRIPTVDVHPAVPSGPLAAHITEDVFVSGVTPAQVTLAPDSDEANDKEQA